MTSHLDQSSARHPSSDSPDGGQAPLSEYGVLRPSDEVLFAMEQRAWGLFLRWKIDEAAELAMNLVRYAPERGWSYGFLAELCLRKQDNAAALSWAGKGIQLGSKDGSLFSIAGEAAYRCGDHMRARMFLRQALMDANLSLGRCRAIERMLHRIESR